MQRRRYNAQTNELEGPAPQVTPLDANMKQVGAGIGRGIADLTQAAVDIGSGIGKTIGSAFTPQEKPIAEAPAAGPPPAREQPGMIEATVASDTRSWNERERQKYGAPVEGNMRPTGEAAEMMYSKGYDYVPLLDSGGVESGRFAWRPPEGLQPQEIVPYGQYQTGKISAEQFEQKASSAPQSFTATGPTTSVTGQGTVKERAIAAAKAGDVNAQRALEERGIQWRQQ